MENWLSVSQPNKTACPEPDRRNISRRTAVTGGIIDVNLWIYLLDNK